jgi:hypothetical protein
MSTAVDERGHIDVFVFKMFAWSGGVIYWGLASTAPLD